MDRNPSRILSVDLYFRDFEMCTFQCTNINEIRKLWDVHINLNQIMFRNRNGITIRIFVLVGLLSPGIFCFLCEYFEKYDVIILASWYLLLCHYNKCQQYEKIYV